MKTRRILATAFVLAAAFAVRSAAAIATPPRAEIIFDHPDKFSDVRDYYIPTDKGTESILGRIREHMVNEAKYYVPAGCKLTVTFTDIHLAGDFEPWRGPQFDEIRIVKDIYPPSFKFTYTLADASGKVLKQGSENIRDINFQIRIAIDTSDPLRYEKDILDEWMRSTLPRKG